MKRKRALIIVGTITAVIVTAVMFQPPIHQWPEYHNFSDKRTIFGIANFSDVLSNLLFFSMGVFGLFIILAKRTVLSDREICSTYERAPYLIFFASIIITAFGSCYYHLKPDNYRLLFDRLPMTVAFMSLFSGILSERIDRKLGRILLVPLLILGLASVLYWYMTELSGQGDLRFYAIVQYLPIVLIPLIILIFPSRYLRNRDITVLIVLYGLAKVFEIYDGEFFSLTGFISGHTIKHFVAALPVYWLARMLRSAR